MKQPRTPSPQSTQTRRSRARRRGLAVLALLAVLASYPTPGVQAAESTDFTVSAPVVPLRFDGSVNDLPPTLPGPTTTVPLGVDGSPVPPQDPHAGGSQIESAGDGAAPGTSPPEFTTAAPNFDGINAGQTGFTPPDTNGDVGPDHYVQIVNSHFRIYDKTGTALTNVSAINSLWTAAGDTGRCATNNRGDPVVLYDHLADRWVILQFELGPDGGFGGTDNNACVATSQSEDPTQGWYVYTFPIANGFDYPKLGVWPDAYLMTSQRGFSGGDLDVYALDRANMLNGNPATIQQRNIGGPALVLLPGDLDGPPPASGTPAPFARQVDGDLWGGVDRVEIYEMTINWGNPAASAFVLAAALPVAAFSSDICDGGNLFNNCLAQPGTASLLEVLPHWPMGPLQYRNFGSHASMVFNHSVDVDGNGNVGVRWYELRKTGGIWTVAQQGTHAPDSNAAGLADDVDRWMGSIAMDQAGNMALGYSAVSGTVFPDIRYTGRLASDPAGLMTQGTPGGSGEVQLVAGTASQNGTRWGDYSAMRVDPTDGCTFWYTTEYGGATVWSTRVGAFRFPTCNPADVRVSQTDSPDAVIAGEELTYRVTVTNDGPSPATDVVVTEVLGSGLTLSTATTDCTEAPAGTVTCDLDSIAAGASRTFDIRARVSDGAAAASGPTTVSSTVTVAAAQLDPVPGNNAATSSTSINELADLAVAKLCDAELLAGETGTCSIFVDNSGPSDARTVTIRDSLTSTGTFDVTGATVTPAGSCTGVPQSGVSSAIVTCTLSSALDSATPSNTGRARMTVSFRANDAQAINDSASAASATPDPDTSDNSATASTPVRAVSGLRITSISASPEPVKAGEPIRYDVTVSNSGPSRATDVVVEHALPAGVSVTSVTAPGALACNSGVPGDPLQPAKCGFDVLLAGASKTMTVEAVVASSTTGPLHSDARVTSGTLDPDTSNNYATTDTTVVVEADLGLTLVDTPDPVVAGKSVTYTSTVSNAGPSRARGVTLSVDLDDRVQYLASTISNEGAGTCAPVEGAPDKVDCRLNDLAPGRSVLVYTTALVRSSTSGLATLSTSAAATGVGDPTPVNAATALTEVDAESDLAVQHVGPAKYKPSTTITYFNTVTDTGPSDAPGVTLTVNLPGTKVGSYKSDNSGGLCAVTSSTQQAIVLTCNLGAIASSTAKTVEVQYYIVGNAKLLETSASATPGAPATDPDTSDDSSTWFTTSK